MCCVRSLGHCENAGIAHRGVVGSLYLAGLVVLCQLGLEIGALLLCLLDDRHEKRDWVAATYGVLGLLQVAFEALAIVAHNRLNSILVQAFDVLVNGRSLVARAEVKALAPVTEVARDDKKSFLIQKVRQKRLCVAGHLVAGQLADHQRQELDFFVAKHLPDVRDMHLKTVFVLFEANWDLLELGEIALFQLCDPLLINGQVAKGSLPLSTSRLGDEVKADLVRGAHQDDPLKL